MAVAMTYPFSVSSMVKKMEKATILLVDDEPDILELLAYNLKKENYRVICARDGEQALRLACQTPLPDLIILDLMLPGIDGLEVCKQLKQQPSTACIPIIMLTAKGEEADMVVGLELGADDYITKPFSPRVLIARLKAALRRSALPEKGKPIQIGELSIDLPRHKVQFEGATLHLTPFEFGLLVHLARHRGQVFSRNQLLDVIQGEEIAVVDRTVDVHIVSLRKKLKDCGSCIETVRGVGYRFRE